MLQAQIYIDKDEMIGAEILYEFILKMLIKNKIVGATVFQGMFGYRGNKFLHNPNKLFSFDEVPIMITFIDGDEKVKLALTALRKLVKSGFIVTHVVENW